MPRTFVDEYGMTCTEPTEVEQAEYDTAKAKEEVERATDEIDKTMSKIETVSERLRILIENDNVKAAMQPVFYSILDVFGERYNKTCFRGKSYYEYHWQGVEIERSFLVSAIESWNSEYEYLFIKLKRVEENYREQEQSYNQLAGKALSEISSAFADRSMSTKAEEQGKASEACEAELDKYRLHRRFWDEDKGPIPKEDQDKYTAIQTEAKAIIGKIDAQSEDFRYPIKLRMKQEYYERLAYRAQEESDNKKFVEDNKDGMDDAGLDGEDFEGKVPEEVISQKWEELIEKMKLNKARRRELFEQWHNIQMKMRQELREYDTNLETAVPGFGKAEEVLMERDS